MPVVVAIAVGGALGAVGRYGVDRFIEHHVITVFPWSTFVVNATGCLLAGAVVGALVERHHLPYWVRAGAVIGALGAYTTFSTFAQETLDLLEGSHVVLGLGNVLASTATGIAAVALGLAIGRNL